MKSSFCKVPAVFAFGVIVLFLNRANASDLVVPAGTIVQCTLSEPNFSSATVEIGDPVVCHLRGMMEFGQQVFPRGSYLVGHLESAKDPGHFFGKGNLALRFDRIGLPGGDVPVDAKISSTRAYSVDKQGKIRGKGHAKRDTVEWLLPPLWPWKVITLPARGPRPQLKGETTLSLRLMDDIQIPQATPANGRAVAQFQTQSFHSPYPARTFAPYRTRNACAVERPTDLTGTFLAARPVSPSAILRQPDSDQWLATSLPPIPMSSNLREHPTPLTFQRPRQYPHQHEH